jgi:hypothetical protein
MEVVFHPDTNRAVWTFPGLADGRLPEGSYRALVSTADVEDLAGRTLTQPVEIVFHVLPGDASGDGVTNDRDLFLVWQAQGDTGVSAADLNGDAVVDGADVAVVTGNYLAAVPPGLGQGAPLMAPPAAARSRAAGSPAAPWGMDLNPAAASEKDMRAFELSGFDADLLSTPSLVMEDMDDDDEEEEEKDLLITNPELEPTPIRHG